MMRKIILLGALILSTSCKTKKEKTDNFSEDPIIETSDISNFWTAFDSIKNTNDKARVFKALYFDNASELFQKMIEDSGDIRNVENYLKSFEKYPKFWASLREPTLELRDIRPKILAGYKKVKEVYPEFNAGDVCVFIGVRSIEASAWRDENLIFMGAELNVPYDDINVSELKRAETLAYQNDIESTIIHETIHLQQKSDSDSLLGHSIHEGSADFLAELFVGKPYKNQAYIYGRKNEQELWEEFSGELHSTNISKWMYAESGTEERPTDLGYFMGYMITKSFYEKAENKEKAIREIIEVEDFDKFLEISGYRNKFERK